MNNESNNEEKSRELIEEDLIRIEEKFHILIKNPFYEDLINNTNIIKSKGSTAELYCKNHEYPNINLAKSGFLNINHIDIKGFIKKIKDLHKIDIQFKKIP